MLFSFLRDTGKDLFEKEYSIIRNWLKKHKVRPLLHKTLKSLAKMVGDDPQSVCALAGGIDTGRIDPEVVGKMSAPAGYAMVHWALDTSELDGYEFPLTVLILSFTNE